MFVSGFLNDKIIEFKLKPQITYQPNYLICVKIFCKLLLDQSPPILGVMKRKKESSLLSFIGYSFFFSDFKKIKW